MRELQQTQAYQEIVIQKSEQQEAQNWYQEFIAACGGVRPIDCTLYTKCYSTSNY